MLVKLSAHNSISELKSNQDRRCRDNVKMYALKYQMIELNPKFNSQMLLDNLVEKTPYSFQIVILHSASHGLESKISSIKFLSLWCVSEVCSCLLSWL